MTKSVKNWFVAQLVERVRVQDDPRSVVHVNYILLSAEDASEALQKAKKIGRTANISYANPDGKRVDIRFLGIHELTKVHDEIGDGGELLYTEAVGLSQEDSYKLVRPRGALSVFRRPVAAPGPNYAAGEILEEAKARVVRSRKGRGKSRRQRRSRRGVA